MKQLIRTRTGKIHTAYKQTVSENGHTQCGRSLPWNESSITILDIDPKQRLSQQVTCQKCQKREFFLEGMHSKDERQRNAAQRREDRLAEIQQEIAALIQEAASL